MTNELWLIVASYVSSEDARADLATLDELYRQDGIEAYDAALIVTDAWSQVSVIAHTSRTAADATIGPIHDAFKLLFGGHDAVTTLLGGPYLGGKAPPLAIDRRLPSEELTRIGQTLGPASVRAVVLVLAAENLELADVLVNSDWGAIEVVEPMDENVSVLASRVTAMTQRLAAGRAANTEMRRAPRSESGNGT